MGIIIIFRILLVLAVLFVLLYVLLPNVFLRAKKPLPPLSDLEQRSIDILNEKREIRGVTDETQKTINQIQKNLEE